MSHAERPWVIRMRWLDLLFAHWQVAPADIQRLLPDGLVVDTFDGSAWVGVVPFEMADVSPRGLPALPRLSRFLELNVRTYVTYRGRPGVWFFSLDATSRLAVRGARRFFHLPYFDARMSSERRSGFVHYRSERVHRGAPEARFAARYRSTGPAGRSELETWLTERYCLYAETKGAIFRGDIHHRPWPLENGEAEIETVDMTGLLGMDLPRTPPLTHFSERLDVVGWPLLPVERLP